MSSKVIRLDDFSIEYEMLPGYLRAYVFDGVDTLDLSIRMWTKLGELCDEHGTNRILVLENLEGEVGGDVFDVLSKAMLDAGFAKRRIAFVELTNDHLGNEIGEIVCLELGITVMVFTNEPAARSWLLYGEGPPAGLC